MTRIIPTLVDLPVVEISAPVWEDWQATPELRYVRHDIGNPSLVLQQLWSRRSFRSSPNLLIQSVEWRDVPIIAADSLPPI